MAGWVLKLDDFLKLSDREILDHAGKISHEKAVERARAEYANYQRQQAALPQPVDQQFDRSLEELRQIESQDSDQEKS
jgi:hypothetical protein